jgi:polar amino acid transport system substrate-binding protein
LNSFQEPISKGDTSKPSTLDTVIKNGVIRAGYVSNPPSCIVDPNTGKVSGVMSETFEKLAQKASLNVEWVEEVGFGSMIEGLNTGRYDAVPCGIWVTAERSRTADFTRPLYYSGIGVYVRSDDTRFDKDLSQINSPDVRIATIDGEVAQSIANTAFPRAKEVGLPQLSEISIMLLNVKTGRADVAFVESYAAYEFVRNNPGSLRNIAAEKPFRIFPNTILVRKGDSAFRRFLDNALGESINLGIVDELLKKYEPQPGTFYRTVLPYQPNQP